MSCDLTWIHPREPTGRMPLPIEPDGERLGEQLKCYFDSLTAGPVPDRLLRLTEALEAAFERGELCVRSRKARS